MNGLIGAKTGSIFQQYRRILKMCRNQFIIPALYIVHCFRHIFGRWFYGWLYLFVGIYKMGIEYKG